MTDLDRAVTRTEVDVGYRMSYHEAGTGPTLVLLHGAGPGVSGWSNFHGNFAAFAARYRTIIVDLPGFGSSECPPLDRPYPQVAAEGVARLLDALSIDHAHVLGNSMGAFAAAELALTRPALVDRLVMMGFGGIGVNVLTPLPSEGGLRAREFAAEPTRASLVKWLECMVERRSILTEDLIEERFANATAPGAIEHMAQVRASLSTAGGADDVPRGALVGKITSPTLLTWGRDDRMVPWEHALLPLRQMPDVELHVFSGCGHWAQVERKADFERVVMEFLTRQMEKAA